MIFRSVCILAFALLSGCWMSSVATGQYLRTNGRFLATDEGKPFFWLGDTAWEIFHRLTREEARYYLRNRAGKGFTVVQAVVLGEINGITAPNKEGELPLTGMDPSTPNERYFDLVDHVLDEAAAAGLYVALVPTWGAHVEDQWHPLFENVHVFTPENARTYGRFLGARYGTRWNVVWVLGGDRPATGNEAIWDAMAAGIKDGGGTQVMTYHPYGGHSSSEWVHEREWLDFNMVQVGHQRFSNADYTLVSRDYGLTPVKPTINAEPNYEELPAGFSEANPRFTDYDVRKAAYWSVFAGAFGHTYGHNSLWQIYRGDDSVAVLWPISTWREALEAPGGTQMQHLRRLMLSRPFFNRIPDQSLLATDDRRDSDHVQVTRDGTPGRNDATYILAYLPMASGISLNTRVIEGDTLKAWWYDPRTGTAYPLGRLENEGTYSPAWEHRIRKEMGGPDWVLVVDDAAQKYPPPGTVTHQTSVE